MDRGIFTEESLILLYRLKWVTLSLCEMCPNTEFFLVRIFPHSDSIRRDTSYLSILSPNAGKYWPKKTPYLDTFHAVFLDVWSSHIYKSFLFQMGIFRRTRVPFFEWTILRSSHWRWFVKTSVLNIFARLISS